MLSNGRTGFPSRRNRNRHHCAGGGRLVRRLDVDALKPAPLAGLAFHPCARLPAAGLASELAPAPKDGAWNRFG